MTGSSAPSASSKSRTPAPGKYLSEQGLEQLKAYKYVSAPLTSWVDKQMTHYWEFCVNLLPMWLAPNAVTTFSFLHAILAHLLIQYYSPNLKEQAPNWAYIVVALCMFLYQTLDAIDGKQARRTKNGSPLGQLFDHGCDAVTAGIMAIFIAATCQTGPTYVAYTVLVMILVSFFAANWEESCTSVMRFGAVGVTEGQFITMGIELLTGIYGPDIWLKHVFPDLLGMSNILPWMTTFHVMLVFGLIGTCFQVVSSIYVVLEYYRQRPKEDRTQAIVSFTQYSVAMILATLWVAAPSNAMVNHPRILLSIISLLCSYQASRLIICHTTGEHYPRWFAILWPLPLVVLNEWSGRLFNGKDTQLWFDQTLMGYAYVGIVAVLYVHFVVVTIDQITTFLGIKCFKIKPIPQENNKGK